jgi:alpha/beta hydrolase fold
MPESASEVCGQAYNPQLGSVTPGFIDRLAACCAHAGELAGDVVRRALVALQTKPTGKRGTPARLNSFTALVMVKFSRASEGRFSIVVEEAYAATRCSTENSACPRDGSRIAVVGRGHVAAATCKQHGGTRAGFLVLFYPATGANFDTACCQACEGGPRLTKRVMALDWAADVPNTEKPAERKAIAQPVHALRDILS